MLAFLLCMMSKSALLPNQPFWIIQPPFRKVVSSNGQIIDEVLYFRWASGQVVRALDCCAKHQWFEPNPRIIVGMLAHCSPSSKWVPGGNTREVKGGEERNWPPYLTMPTAQDKCPL